MPRRAFGLILIPLFLLTACGGQEFEAVPFSSKLGGVDGDQGGDSNNPGDGSGEDPGDPWPGLTICSKLNFQNLTWPEQLPVSEPEAFALSLNISGSFEGNSGWSNLAPNFDGQGISLGLLNQNLGQGSLQPMMIELSRRNHRAFASVFGATRFQSLIEMLKLWDTTFVTSSFTRSGWLERHGFNELDDPEAVVEAVGEEPVFTSAASNARNQVSVDWSQREAHNGSRLKSEWSSELKAMSELPEYRSIQVSVAQSYHGRARGLFYEYALTELRSYLFFFDIVVQNGSIPRVDKDDYANWIRSNPKATEEQRLLKILEFRLRHVRSQFVEDVRLRKTAVILGRGRVHGANRDFNSEFCTNTRTPALGTIFALPNDGPS